MKKWKERRLDFLLPENLVKSKKKVTSQITILKMKKLKQKKL
jgi:hypothetical protein